MGEVVEHPEREASLATASAPVCRDRKLDRKLTRDAQMRRDVDPAERARAEQPLDAIRVADDGSDESVGRHDVILFVHQTRIYGWARWWNIPSVRRRSLQLLHLFAEIGNLTAN